MKPHPCPMCKKPVLPGAPATPFCSERCRLIDLGNWLGGKYALPAEDQSELPDDLPPAKPKNDED